MSRVSRHRHALQACALRKGESRVRSGLQVGMRRLATSVNPGFRLARFAQGRQTPQAAERDAARICAQAVTRTEATEEYNR
jgi:hypothetical protein